MPSNTTTTTTTATNHLKRLLSAVLLATISVVGLATVPASADARVAVEITPQGDVKVTTVTASTLVINVDHNDDGDLVLHWYSGGTTVPASHFRRDLIVDLTGGSTEFNIDRVDVPRDLRVTLGNGTDSYQTVGLTVGRNLVIATGDGAAYITNRGPVVAGTTTITPGSGFTRIGSGNAQFLGNYTVNGPRAGDVEIFERGSTFARNYRVRTGNGVDTVTFDSGSIVSGTVTVDLRNGDDDVFLKGGSIFRKRVTVRLGNDQDNFSADGVELRQTYLFDLGRGDDIGALSRSELVRRGTVNGGQGSDLFGIADVTPNVPVTVRGVEAGYGF